VAKKGLTRRAEKSRGTYTGERALDPLLALIVLVLLAPFMALVALVVRLVHGSPVLFSQQRLGLHGESFTMLKFRSMTNQTDDEGHLMPADRRDTVGPPDRRPSLDKVPKLFNVLRGDMSVISPWPLLMQYLELYTHEQMRRHDAKPGITG
jgi:sugar transferase EpsL